ncbi:MAG: pantetheine-phosphate adenylyltransferase, partial [Sedimentisphaerales bacterium]
MAKKFVRAIFPGSFDPITNGHLDVINRGMKLFDELVVAVGRSPVKNQLFTPEERVEMIAELVRKLPGVSVEAFEGLTVEYATSRKADVILRGLRSLTDVQYEFQLAMTNRAVAGIETIFIMT